MSLRRVSLLSVARKLRRWRSTFRWQWFKAGLNCARFNNTWFDDTQHDEPERNESQRGRLRSRVQVQTRIRHPCLRTPVQRRIRTVRLPLLILQDWHPERVVARFSGGLSESAFLFVLGFRPASFRLVLVGSTQLLFREEVHRRNHREDEERSIDGYVGQRSGQQIEPSGEGIFPLYGGVIVG